LAIEYGCAFLQENAVFSHSPCEIALAETGTLSGAARALKVDHATVGRRVSALEQALGGQLIERLPKRWVLTESGRRVAEVAQGIVGRVFVRVRQGRVVETRVDEGGRSGTHRTADEPPAISSQAFSPITWTPISCCSGTENTSFSRPQRSPIKAPRGLFWYLQRPTT